jgi:hypothetical protein
VSYNAVAVKTYNATSSLVLFKNKNIHFSLEKSSSLLQRWRSRIESCSWSAAEDNFRILKLAKKLTPNTSFNLPTKIIIIFILKMSVVVRFRTKPPYVGTNVR